jgi:hypothetical protein
MPILFIILIILILTSYGGGFYRPAYRTHGISVGTVLLLVLLLWLFGVFGSRPF